MIICVIRRVTFDGRPNEMQCESVRFDIGVLVTMTTKPSIPNREVNARIHKKAKTKQKKKPTTHRRSREPFERTNVFSILMLFLLFFQSLLRTYTHIRPASESRRTERRERPRRCRTRTTEREWQRWNCCRVWACARARVCLCYSCAASGMLSSCGHTYTRSNWRTVALVCA